MQIPTRYTPENKITIPGCWVLNREFKHELQQITWFFCGGFFIGNERTIRLFNNLVKLEVLELLENHEIRALIDNRNETIGKKIREAEIQKMPYMLIVGEEEEKNGTISVRSHGQEGKGNIIITVDEFARIVIEEIAKTLKTFEV
jgi:histidyl-tRNA synthetase